MRARRTTRGGARCSGRRARAARGFSYTELVVVLAIIGVVGAIAAPRVWGSVAYRRVDGAARIFAADLNAARAHAIRMSADQEVTIRIQGPNKKYTLVGMEHPDDPAKVYRRIFEKDLYGLGCDSTTMSHTSGLITVTYDMHGHPSQGGEIVISVGGHTRTVTIDAQTGVAGVLP